MTLTVDQLRGVLLDLIAPRRVPDHAVLAGLQEEEWTALVTMGHQHRVLPLAHARLGAEGADWPVPERVRTACADSFRGYSFHAIRSQRVIALAVRALAILDVGCVICSGCAAKTGCIAMASSGRVKVRMMAFMACVSC